MSERGIPVEPRTRLMSCAGFLTRGALVTSFRLELLSPELMTERLDYDDWGDPVYVRPLPVVGHVWKDPHFSCFRHRTVRDGTEVVRGSASHRFGAVSDLLRSAEAQGILRMVRA